MRTKEIAWILLLWAALSAGCDDDEGVSDTGTDSNDTPELCGDNADNDGDGLVDCEDEECASLPVCEVPDQWISTWVSSQQLIDMQDQMPPEPGLAGNTLRQVIRLTLGGSEIRITFSNGAGNGPLEISAAAVALSLGGGVIDGTSHTPLTFSGQPSATIQSAGVITSDPIPMVLSPLTDLAITARFGATVPERITGHPGSRANSYLAEGDTVAAADMSGAVKAERWYFLGAVEVMTSGDARAVVALGDSITDGRGSTTDGNNRWPNVLAMRLLGNVGTQNTAVLNQGIGGNCVTRKCLGPSMQDRFERDVLALSGVKWVVFLAGINDLGNDVAGDQVIAAFTEMSARARAAGITVIGGTVMPCEGNSYYNDALETDRQRINEWIRSSDLIDAVIDFDVITRDPAAPTRLSAEVDSGDALHPSAAGYKIMGDAIDLGLFQ